MKIFSKTSSNFLKRKFSRTTTLTDAFISIASTMNKKTRFEVFYVIHARCYMHGFYFNLSLLHYTSGEKREHWPSLVCECVFFSAQYEKKEKTRKFHIPYSHIYHLANANAWELLSLYSVHIYSLVVHLQCFEMFSFHKRRIYIHLFKMVSLLCTTILKPH